MSFPTLLGAPWGPVQWGVLAAGLVVAGMLLLIVELLVLPGFGVAGFLALGALGAGGWMAWAHLGPLWAVLTVGTSVVAGVLLVWAAWRSRHTRGMVLDASEKDARAPAPDLAALVGREGVALSPLRPAGAAEFGDQRVDVVADGVFLDAGTRVRVAAVEGVRVIVEPAEPAPAEPARG